jgi:very-short-patch-repair endonuclease
LRTYRKSTAQLSAAHAEKKCMQAEIALARRRELRTWSTDAEQTLWRCLRAERLEGVKFRRQHSVGPYIVDFFCAEHALAVELDGGQHYSDLGKARDERRTRYLEACGIRVVRFGDTEVFEDLTGVLEAIRQLLGK